MSAIQHSKRRGFYVDLPDLGISISGPDEEKVKESLRCALVSIIEHQKQVRDIPLALPSKLIQEREPDVCRGRHGGHPLSEAANPSSDAKEKVRLQIIEFIRQRGVNGATADEIAAEWNCSHNHVAPRISELQDDGRLVPRHLRKTRAGRNARVYVLP